MISDDTNQEFENKRKTDHSHIKGWGVDINPKNDPTYPMKKRTDEEIRGYTWDRPPLQEQDIEVLHSVERPNVTAVFGTAAPPTGVSGHIRRAAFKKSESSYGRWIPLVLADRIGVYEGLLDDLKKGYLPNIFKERGYNAELKYNKKNFLLKTAVTAAVTAGVIALLVAKRNKSRI